MGKIIPRVRSVQGAGLEGTTEELSHDQGGPGGLCRCAVRLPAAPRADGR